MLVRVISLVAACILGLLALVSLVEVVQPALRMGTDTSGGATGEVLGHLARTLTLAVAAAVLTRRGLRGPKAETVPQADPWKQAQPENQGDPAGRR